MVQYDKSKPPPVRWKTREDEVHSLAETTRYTDLLEVRRRDDKVHIHPKIQISGRYFLIFHLL